MKRYGTLYTSWKFHKRHSLKIGRQTLKEVLHCFSGALKRAPRYSDGLWETNLFRLLVITL